MSIIVYVMGYLMDYDLVVVDDLIDDL
ncbi:hypothetical protein A2U01_0061272, partial [Trifolium medium]|nr:hypothetical protein [Trifolium medium]